MLQRKLNLEALEARTVPTAHLLIDFAGGTFDNQSGYGIGLADGTNSVTVAAETVPVDKQAVLNSVAATFSPFDVQVSLDDRGVASLNFSIANKDKVVVVTDNPVPGIPVPNSPYPVEGLSIIDRGHTNADVGFAFAQPTHDVDPAHFQFDMARTVAHEAGRLFGLTTDTATDPAGDQVMSNAPTPFGTNLQPQFASVALPHDVGGTYSDADYLNSVVGKTAYGSQLEHNAAVLASIQASLPPGVFCVQVGLTDDGFTDALLIFHTGSGRNQHTWVVGLSGMDGSVILGPIKVR